MDKVFGAIGGWFGDVGRSIAEGIIRAEARARCTPQQCGALPHARGALAALQHARSSLPAPCAAHCAPRSNAPLAHLRRAWRARCT
jgi:hypothetical protein